LKSARAPSAHETSGAPIPRNPVASFARGLSYLPRAFRLIRADRRLRRYALLPFLINLAVFALALTAFIHWFPDLLALVSGWTRVAQPEAWYALPLYWLAAAARWLIAVLLLAAAALVTWFTFTLLGNVIASPFNEALSAATERALGSGPPEGAGGLLGFTREGWRAASDEIRRFAFFLLVQATLLPLNLVPVAGNVAYAGCSIAFGVLFMALDYTDSPMSRRRIPVGRRRRVVAANPALMSGFGGALFLAIFVPGLSLVCMPLGVVGGTLLYLDLERTRGLPALAGTAVPSEGAPEKAP
jgi:CysZ protein